MADQKKKKNSFGFNLADEKKMKLIDILKDDDDFLASSHFCVYGDSQEVGIIEGQEQNLLRRSLAWDSAFFNSAGVLDLDELSIMNKGFRKTNDVRNRSSELESTPIAHGFSADSFECNVFDKSPESGLRQKGTQAMKKVDDSSRSKMKSCRSSIGRSINVQSDGKTKKEGRCIPTSRRRNGTTPSPLPQKATGSATNISTRLYNNGNLFGKSHLKMDKRSTISSTTSSITSKIWRYSGRSKGMGNDINASTRSLPLPPSKRMSIESKDAKEASALKGSLQSSSTQTLRPSGIRPPSSLTRISNENSAPSYHGETRSRKLPEKVISKGTTFGSSNSHGSACKKLKTPCSDVPKNIKRPKIEENGMKKPSYSFDRLENLSKYFEAIDLNQDKCVNRPTKHNIIDVATTSIPRMRTPLSDKTFSCNFNGTSMEPKRVKFAKKASSIYAASKVLAKENS